MSMFPSVREVDELYGQEFFLVEGRCLFSAVVSSLPNSDFVKPSGQVTLSFCWGLGDQRLIAESASVEEVSSEAEEECIPVPAAEDH